MRLNIRYRNSMLMFSVPLLFLVEEEAKKNLCAKSSNTRHQRHDTFVLNNIKMKKKKKRADV